MFHFFLFLLRQLLDAQKMPVSISQEQQCNSDVQVKDKLSERAAKKAKKSSLWTTKENKNFSSQSELKLFRIRKKYSRQVTDDNKSKLCKVLKEKNTTNRRPVAQKSSAPDDYNKTGSEITNDTQLSKDVSLKQNQKRKIYESITGEEEASAEKHKLQKLLTSTPEMYEYRMTSVSKTEGDANFLTKNDAAEENLINAFYQQQCLGGSNNSIATLCNIGNSCYLNSVLYTLRFAPHFLHKLHHLVDDMRLVYLRIGQHKLKSSSLGRNVSGVQNHNGRSWSSKDLVSMNGHNATNGVDPVLKNNRQIATEKLHELYQSLHRNESVDSMLV